MNYREAWYAERKLPYEPPVLGDFPPFRCIANAESVDLAYAKRRMREPGEDREELDAS